MKCIEGEKSWAGIRYFPGVLFVACCRERVFQFVKEVVFSNDLIIGRRDDDRAVGLVNVNHSASATLELFDRPSGFECISNARIRVGARTGSGTDSRT